MIKAVASSRHMKMKLPSLEGAVITMKSNQKEAKRCYKNNLKTKRGVCSVTTQPPREKGVTLSRSPGREDPSLQRKCWRGRSGVRSSSLADLWAKKHRTKLPRS